MCVDNLFFRPDGTGFGLRVTVHLSTCVRAFKYRALVRASQPWCTAM